MLEHGGRLRRAAQAYGIAPAHWLDLSTGISPHAWPVPVVPADAWRRLPEDDDGLLAVASRYYGAHHLLPVAGSQAAIQALPHLRPRARVGVIAPGYNEHAHAWRRAGHRVAQHAAADLLAQVDAFDVIVLIHPNNPGGERFGRDELLRCHRSLAARGGWLVIDEAFMDATPGDSVCDQAHQQGLIVLRSVGKFFGLAGARAGFVAAWPALLDALRDQLGPWTLSGPTRHVLQQALADEAWHAQARDRLHADGRRLATLMTRHGFDPAAGCAFFQWWRGDDAPRVHEALARQGILVRLFDAPPSLRFGLPCDEQDWQRLDTALAQVQEATT